MRAANTLASPRICTGSSESSLFDNAVSSKISYAYEQKPPMNEHASVSSGVIGLNFDVSLHLHLIFVYASSEFSGESVHFRRLA